MAAVNPLVVIVGETASGKTALAIELAQKFNGEIICADSRTIYRGMDIGTAKPTPEEQAAVPHHLIDIRDPDERYSAAQFQLDALKKIENIAARRKLPIMVGGTGLYVDAVLYGYTFAPEEARDSVNPRHVAVGKGPKDKHLRDNTLIIGIQRDKEDLESRVASRVKSMLDAGLLDEVRKLVGKYGTHNEVLRGSGYYFWNDYQHGALTMAEAAEKFTRTSTLLAKKQRTWFKRNKSIHWLNDPSKAVDITTTFLSNLSV